MPTSTIQRAENAAAGRKIRSDVKVYEKCGLEVKTSRVMPPGTGTMHVILAVTDHGTPRLTRYRRVIVDVKR